LIASAARAQAALGRAAKVCGTAEGANLVASRRSLCARRPMRAGDVVRPEDVIALRPATGLAPRREPALIGSRLVRDVDGGAPFLEADVVTGVVDAVA
jgi:sialic acid synthase SpsE